MKLIRSQFLTLTLAKNQTSWSFSCPVGLINQQEGDILKICTRQVTWRNDFPTVQSSSSILFGPVGSTPDTVYQAKRGSPNIRDLIKDLNARQVIPPQYNLTAPFVMSFDRSTSKVTVYSPVASVFSTQSYELTIDTAFAEVLGLTGVDGTFRTNYDSHGFAVSVTITFTNTTPTVTGSFEVDLTGPESLFLRMSGLRSLNIEIDSHNNASVRDLLCVMQNDAAPYGTGAYTDQQSVYSQYLASVEALSGFSLSITDSNGTALISQNPVTIVLSIDCYLDDSAEMVETLAQLADMKKTQLLGHDLSVP